MPNNSRFHTANANAILDALDEGALTVPELTALTGLNGRVIRRNLRGLRDAALIVTDSSDETNHPIWARTAKRRPQPKAAKVVTPSLATA